VQNKYLAIIPARAGSKRLPNKNILSLNSKPLIAYSIEAGLNSKYINNVIVSSDSDKILQISQKYGANTIKRPKKLASDTSTTFDAIEHTIKSIEQYEYTVLLQPTSPLRNFEHINKAIELLESNNADAIISVCELDHSPLWSNTLPKDNNMINFLDEKILNKRSQDLAKYYRLNGAIYICKTNKLLEAKTFFLNQNIFAYIMDKKASIDIDDEVDFLTAQTILKAPDFLIGR
jgi:CMP-N-acetylneuraminic acid synthetase